LRVRIGADDMEQQKLFDTFREFEAFSPLSDDDLLVLANRTQIKSIAKNKVLFRQGDQDAWIYCLVRGSLELTADDGRSHRLDAGTRQANQPVARLKPRRYTAKTTTPVRMMCIDGTELGDWHAAMLGSGFQVDEVHGESTDWDLFQEYPGAMPESPTVDAETSAQQSGIDHYERLLEADLELPSLPAIALEARRIIDRDDSSVETLAKLVVNDPPIAAKLIKAANSPVFYGRGSIGTCELAILRLGLKTTRQLVMAFAIRDLFQAEAPKLRQLIGDLWEHSTKVAAMAYVLARRLGSFDPDEAQLAGLLHDIGIVPVLNYAAGQPDLQADVETVSSLAARLQETLGARILGAWNFPEPLVTAARYAEDWWRDEATEPELADLVVVAQLLSFIGTPRILEVPPVVRLPAFKKLFGEQAGVEVVHGLIEEVDDQIQEIQALLRD
jgi:HD-like signal output (HDOD) protein